MHRRMKSGNTETYRQVWEVQANTDTYRLKIGKQRFVDLRLRNADTQIEEWAIHAQQHEMGKYRDIQPRLGNTDKYRHMQTEDWEMQTFRPKIEQYMYID